MNQQVTQFEASQGSAHNVLIRLVIHKCVPVGYQESWYVSAKLKGLTGALHSVETQRILRKNYCETWIHQQFSMKQGCAGETQISGFCAWSSFWQLKFLAPAPK